MVFAVCRAKRMDRILFVAVEFIGADKDSPGSAERNIAVPVIYGPRSYRGSGVIARPDDNFNIP